MGVKIFGGHLRPESPNYLTMDALRFLAALGVVVYHYRGSVQNEALHAALEVLFARAFQLVDLFFVLSGFIIGAVYGQSLTSTKTFGAFMVKRLARLWPLHLLLLLAYLLIWAFSIASGVEVAKPDKYNVDCIMPHVLMLHAFGTCPTDTFNYVSWSISAEMGMYALTPIFLFIAHRSAPALGIVALAIAALLAATSMQGDASWMTWTANFGVIRAVPAFALGVALFFLRPHLKGVPAPQLWFYMSALAFLALPVVWPTMPLLLSWLLVALISVAAASCDVQGRVGPEIKSLSRLSPLTYGLYMWHPLLFTVIVSFAMGRILRPSGAIYDLALLACVGLAILVAFLSLVLIEKPARRSITALVLERGERGRDPAPTSP